MYASKPDYNLGIVHAQHTTFLKLTTTMLHILTLQKKRKQWMEQKKDSITQQSTPTNQRQNESLISISNSTLTCSKRTKQSCRVKEKVNIV